MNVTGLIVASVLLLGASSPLVALPAEFWDLLRSADSETRKAAIRTFALEQTGQSLQDTVKVVQTALADPQMDINVLGANILQRLARSTPLLAQPLTTEDKELIARLNATVDWGIRQAPDEVAAQLAVAYTLYRTDSADYEMSLLTRLDKTSSLTAQRELIDAIAWNGIKTDEARKRLLALASAEPSIVTYEAAVVLAALEVPSRDLVPMLIRLAETDEFFCDPKLLQPLKKNPAEAKKFLPQLKALQARLENELKVDPFKRKTKIYAPDFWMKSLQDVVGALSG